MVPSRPRTSDRTICRPLPGWIDSEAEPSSLTQHSTKPLAWELHIYNPALRFESMSHGIGDELGYDHSERPALHRGTRDRHWLAVDDPGAAARELGSTDRHQQLPQIDRCIAFAPTARQLQRAIDAGMVMKPIYYLIGHTSRFEVG